MPLLVTQGGDKDTRGHQRAQGKNLLRFHKTRLSTAGTPTGRLGPQQGWHSTCPQHSPALGVPPAQHLPPHLFLDLNYSLFGGTKLPEEPG